MKEILSLWERKSVYGKYCASHESLADRQAAIFRFGLRVNYRIRWIGNPEFTTF
jgi:hypothetical protein